MSIDRRQWLRGWLGLGLLLGVSLPMGAWLGRVAKGNEGAASLVGSTDPYGPADAKVTIIVMDPMALPLACDCVQGYAQRRYEKLADYLKDRTGQTVRVIWSESLERALKEETQNRVTLVIGKDSVIRYEAKQGKLEMKPIAQLTDMQGGTKQHGLFVVRRDDKAATLLDLQGYKILWGPEKCDEKSAAPREALVDVEVQSVDGGACASCSVAAKQLMAEPQDAKVCAVISSYAEPLLAGCGTIQKGDLRVIGKSEEVPFVSVFVHAQVPAGLTKELTQALLDMQSAEMLAALETKRGFVPYESP